MTQTYYPQFMEAEFTTVCTRYYKLTQLLSKRRERLRNLLNDAPTYTGQTNLADIDALISYYRNVQACKTKTDETQKELEATKQTVLTIMQYFEIAPGTVLTGEMPGILEFQIWAERNDDLYIIKTKDLAPLSTNPNIIEIKAWDVNNSDAEDDEFR